MKPLSEDTRREIMVATLADPVLFARTFLPHWFPKKIPWAHRGMLAILLRQTDFLLKFGKESWPEGEAEWTMRELALIIKHFVWRPKDGPKDAPPVHLFQLDEWEFPGEDEPRYKLTLGLTKQTEVVWPRGFGKTTIIKAALIIKAVFKLKKFVVYTSEAATHAEMQLDSIKRELVTNATLLSVFGKQKPERNDEQSWRSDFFETVHGVSMMAVGRGGQIRGKLQNNIRPDEVVLDDVEDLESVSTPEQINKTMTWLAADVLPAGNQILKNCEFNIIGTILAKNAMIPQLMGDPDWITVCFGAIDPDGNALWGEYMGLEEIQRKKLSYARIGKLASFYMEFLSKITVAETALFKPPFRIVYMQRTQFVGCALACDPAISDTKDSDSCTFGVTGITEHGHHHVLDTYGKQGMSPRDQVDKFFELHFFWNPTHHGIEAIAYQRALIFLVKEEMFRRAKKWGQRAYFEITPIKHGKQGKRPRIEGILQPRYAAGYFSHQRIFPELETQLIEWGIAGVHDDYPDVIAMCTGLLDPFAATAFDPKTTDIQGNEVVVDDPLSKDYYEPLDDDFYAGAP